MTITINGTTGITNDGGYTGDGVVFADTTPANTLVTTTGGNVGVGTNAPGYKLDVNGAANFQGIRVGTNGDTINGSTGLLTFQTSGSECARFVGSQFLVNTATGPSGSWNANAGANIKYGVQLTHTGNAAIWRQLSWSGDVNDTTLFFPNQAGNVASLSSAGSWTNASDGRLKTNVSDIAYGLSAVALTLPRSYTRLDCAGNYIGFIAQELKEVIPEVVFGSDQTQYGVDYGSLVAVAFKAIQEQQAMIAQLQADVAVLKGTQP